MAWGNFKKAYNMVPRAWMIKALKLQHLMLLHSSNQLRLIGKTETISGEVNLGKVNINRGILQGDALSPLLFVISLIPLILVLRRIKQGYSFQKGKSKLNHLLFMDDLKRYGSSQNEIDSLVRTV